MRFCDLMPVIFERLLEPIFRGARTVKAGQDESERHADSSRLLITGLLVRFQRGASFWILFRKKGLQSEKSLKKWSRFLELYPF